MEIRQLTIISTMGDSQDALQSFKNILLGKIIKKIKIVNAKTKLQEPKANLQGENRLFRNIQKQDNKMLVMGKNINSKLKSAFVLRVHTVKHRSLTSLKR